MLLVLTNSKDATSDYLCKRLVDAGIRHLRLDTDLCAESLRLKVANGRTEILTETEAISPADVRNVWFRRPCPIQLPKHRDIPSAEHARIEWSEALEGFLAQIPEAAWMNHPARNAMASHKIEQLSRAARMRLFIPQTIVTQREDEARSFFLQCGGRIIVKPLGFGYIERSNGDQDSLIYTSRVSDVDIEHRLEAIRASPTLLQEEVRKLQDIRLTIVDQDVHAVGLIAKDAKGKQRLDIRRDNMREVEYTLVDTPEDIKKSLLKLHAAYELRFSAIDMAIDEQGRWIFFEINPNGQWAWTDLLGITDIGESFIRSFSC